MSRIAKPYRDRCTAFRQCLASATLVCCFGTVASRRCFPYIPESIRGVRRTSVRHASLSLRGIFLILIILAHTSLRSCRCRMRYTFPKDPTPNTFSLSYRSILLAHQLSVLLGSRWQPSKKFAGRVLRSTRTCGWTLFCPVLQPVVDERGRAVPRDVYLLL